MHRSRVYAVIVDVPPPARAEATAFWSAALGAQPPDVPAEPQFTALPDGLIHAAIQQIDGDARYHIDFETDDLDAEVARLTALGAAPVSRWLDCHVLRAAGGHLLCVIPVHSDPSLFAATARTWA